MQLSFSLNCGMLNRVKVKHFPTAVHDALQCNQDMKSWSWVVQTTTTMRVLISPLWKLFLSRKSSHSTNSIALDEVFIFSFLQFMIYVVNEWKCRPFKMQKFCHVSPVHSCVIYEHTMKPEPRYLSYLHHQDISSSCKRQEACNQQAEGN